MRSKRSQPKKTAPGRRTLDGWRGNAIGLELSADDLDLLDKVITLVPILRIVAAIGQEARKRNLQYPVNGVADLGECLGKTSLLLGNHRIDPDSIARTMPVAWFPIVHEGELLSRVHLALLHCEMEAAQMSPRPAIHRA
jgi:hypothetical protein